MTVDKTKGWSFTYYVQGRKENKNDIAVFFFQHNTQVLYRKE